MERESIVVLEIELGDQHANWNKAYTTQQIRDVGPNVGLKLTKRRRRWANFKLTLDQRHVFAG